VAALPAHRRDLGFVFQHYALFPHLTAAQNIAYPLRRRRVARRDIATRVREAMELVHLDDLGDRLPAQLSGGQQQRVALARAIVYQPRVLLLDEPLGALDRQLRERLQRELKRLHRELGITFVCVTHDQDEALSMADRIAIFDRGRLQQVGTPSELYRHPDSLFVARFLGDSTVLRGCRPSGDGALVHAGTRLGVPEGVSGRAGPVALVLRPEALFLSARDAARPDGVNAIGVDVADVVYLGHTRRVTVVLPDGTEGSITQAADDPADWRPGESAWLTWSPQHGAVVPDPEPGANPAPAPAHTPATERSHP
jgi:putative spermidine/putrescine transport system ATP-binding protein